ncbi:hypothetical protein MIND_00555500 [Mycena indigotica]|uniref:ABC transporter domain-containing protein n=1 Tax=Mycena indigotica TaxID=2126181 RepID=A0A8H6SX57_9AGAR|nr:uncharacterized protein MIND_00555500 [Mycena indigotica]KAF7307603.1 hypothetical protein MIND_00555500 [Mycena indigotica]
MYTGNLGVLASVSRVSENVLQVLGQNPGLGEDTLQSTKNYIIGKKRPFALVDLGEGRTEYTPLLEFALKEATKGSATADEQEVDVSDIILPYWRTSHSDGLATILGLLRRLWNERNGSLPFKPPRLHTFPLQSPNPSPYEQFYPIATPLLSPPTGNSYTVSPTGRLFHELIDGQTFTNFRVFRISSGKSGHTTDSIYFHVPSDKVLCTAGAVFAQKNTVFEDLAAYMRSLQHLLTSVREGGIEKLYPGHGTAVFEGRDLIEGYIAHEQDRATQLFKFENPVVDNAEVEIEAEPMSIDDGVIDNADLVIMRYGFQSDFIAPGDAKATNALSTSWALGDTDWKDPPQNYSVLLHVIHEFSGAGPVGLCDINTPTARLHTYDWPVMVKKLIVRGGQGEPLRFVFVPDNSDGLFVEIEDGATVLQCIRSRWRNTKTIIQQLVRIGAAFSLCWRLSTGSIARWPPAQVLLGRRRANYQPTTVDYRAYVKRRDAFLTSPRGRVALFQGGFVARIARMVIPNYQEVIRSLQGETVPEYGVFLADIPYGGSLWYQALTPSEIDLVLGVYMVETGQPDDSDKYGAQVKYASFWPTLAAFQSSGLSVGWWSPNCERWFQKRLMELQGGTGNLLSTPEWRSKIRFNAQGRRTAANNSTMARKFLESCPAHADINLSWDLFSYAQHSSAFLSSRHWGPCMPLLWRQFSALFWKNWIVLSKHPFLNILRCFIFPVAYGIFLAVAKKFLLKPNNYGIGSPIPIYSLQDRFHDAGTLVWADATDGKSQPSPDDIMARITNGFTDRQLASVKKSSSAAQLPFECPQNFNGFSECYAAVIFYDIPTNATKPINYTVLADSGLFHIDVVRHASDFETRVLPLQWAVDEAIIQLRTGVSLPTPREWAFTNETNVEQDDRTRLSFVRGIRELLVIAFFVCFSGISYQLPGAYAGERATQVTAHMRAMGLFDSARIAAWHLSYSLIYLPAWVIVSLVWRSQIWVETNVLMILAVHILFGLSLASWSFFVAAPFGKSPQLAAVFSTFLSIMFAIIALILKRVGTGGAFFFTIIFPPGFYIFANRAISGYENHRLPTDAIHGDPDHQLALLTILIAGLIDVFLWPYLGVVLERRLYDPREPSASRSWKCWGRRRRGELQMPVDVAVSVQGLGKTFNTSMFNRKGGAVTAIEELSFDVPQKGIFVLLGSNGAGKSTSLSIIGGLVGRTKGEIVFEGGVSKPPRGTLGIVPQKNVLISELSCLQTLKLWRAVKWSGKADKDEDLVQLLKDCDLGNKIHANADTLSGGQKRKLQLAIGLVGGSNIVLVDECTSGVDPLSRRALWRTLISFRQERTIIFTTHFLDEADLLADHIAILAAPGKLVASGSPVALKRDLGEGYTVQVTLAQSSPVEEKAGPSTTAELLGSIRAIAPLAHVALASPHQPLYHLKSKDTAVVDQVLRLLDNDKEKYGVASYDVLGTSIEDIFLDLMRKEDAASGNRNSMDALDEADKSATPSNASIDDTKHVELNLVTGRATSPFRQALTIFRKRAIIFKRSWLTPVLAVLIAIAGSTIPLVFISGRAQSCVKTLDIPAFNEPLFPPLSTLLAFYKGDPSRVLISPPSLANTFGNLTAVSAANIANFTAFFNDTDIGNTTALQPFSFLPIADNATFVSTIQNNIHNISTGGVSLDVTSGQAFIAWEASPPGLMGPSILSLASNLLFNHALNVSGRAGPIPALMLPTYESFPPVDAGTLFALKWIAFFCAVMSVFPAFFALYVSKERRSSVQAMQFSNGLHNPVGLWLGHLMFDAIFTVIMSTIVIIIFAAVSNQFHGLGFFWLVMVLYGIAGTLFAYCCSLIVVSPLAAFATVAGYQIVMFVLYLAGYLLTLTYAKTSDANHIITIIHFTLSILSPVASVTRAGLVSVNLFSLLCNGEETNLSASWMASIMRYGGPIVYLVIYSLVLLGILVWVDSGSLFPRRFKKQHSRSTITNSETNRPVKEDVILEAQAAAGSNDLLRVLNVSKTFGKNTVVDDVSFGVSKDTVFCMLGPNGAGKTTTFNVIRGDVIPESGDALIQGISVLNNPRAARVSLGVCPQFSAIDAQLSVREHLEIYGRLKGLSKTEVDTSVDSLLDAIGLRIYADRLASKLSGGNQRKLSLAIALMGNPSVVCIDEFSTGIDAKKKREMWSTLRAVSANKAVIITTHSMEEAAALATKVGILAKRMLAVGTTEQLSARYATYEVHFACRTREEVARAQAVMSTIPGSRMADDVATRFEVPIERENGLSLAELFHRLSTHDDFSEYTVEKATLESVFLKVIRENNVQEEDTAKRGQWRRLMGVFGR